MAGLDLGTIRVFLEAEMVRVCCPVHGVVATTVPWARHGSWFTRDFEDTVGWLATATSKTAITADEGGVAGGRRCRGSHPG